MRKGLLLSIVLGLLSLACVADGLYPIYHDCTATPGGYESATRLYIANPNDTGVQYTIAVYSVHGVALGTADYFVNPHAANHIWLPDLIPGDRSNAWGLCTVQTWPNYPTEIHVVAERYIGNSLIDYDTVPPNAVSGRHTFFYNAWHSAGGPDNDTHVSILNPTDTANGYIIEIYDVYGNLAGSTRGIANPKRTNVHRLSDLLSGARDFTWGLCVVRSETYAYEQFAVSVFRMRDNNIIDTVSVP